MRMALEDEGYDVDEGRLRRDGLERFAEQPADVVLIDLMLPGMARIRVLPPAATTERRPRHHGHRPDDTMTSWPVPKPAPTTTSRSPRGKELAARIRALLAGLVRSTNRRLTFGDIEVRPDEAPSSAPARGPLHPDRIPPPVRTRHQPGQGPQSRAALDRVWGYDYFGDGRLVSVHIRRLRTKIEPDPANPATSDRAGNGLQADGLRTCDARTVACAWNPTSGGVRPTPPGTGQSEGPPANQRFGLGTPVRDRRRWRCRPRWPVSLPDRPPIHPPRTRDGDLRQAYVNASCGRRAPNAQPEHHPTLENLAPAGIAVGYSNNVSVVRRLPLGGERAIPAPCAPSSSGTPATRLRSRGFSQMVVGLLFTERGRRYFEVFSLATSPHLRILGVPWPAPASSHRRRRRHRRGQWTACAPSTRVSKAAVDDRRGRLARPSSGGRRPDLSALAASSQPYADALLQRIEREALSPPTSARTALSLTTLVTSLGVLESHRTTSHPQSQAVDLLTAGETIPAPWSTTSSRSPGSTRGQP